MFPVLFSIGSFSLYSFTVFLLLAWFIFSFFFWRYLRDKGIDETRIYDLMSYGTIATLIGARIGFVVFHQELFTGGGKWIRVFTLWLQPGFSLYGGLIAGLLFLIYFSYQTRIGRSYVIDAFGASFGYAWIIGALGVFLDGTVIGTLTNGPLAIHYKAVAGARHPVALYELCIVGLIMALLSLSAKVFPSFFHRNGIRGVWFFLLFSVTMFGVEFLKDTPVYFGGLRANQWVLILIFSQSMGALLTVGGGIRAITALFVRVFTVLKKRRFHARVS